jgi:hypothetical protein
MPDSPLVVAGAQVQPTNAAALHSNEFFTGLWTQGNPLGPGAVPYLYTKFYSASRFDRLVGGANTEITTRLTLGRRPGNSIYNSSLFPPISRFFCFRGFSSSGERIRIMASVDPATGSNQGTVRDVTGPTTNLIVWTKDSNAGRTSFVSVGNVLYFGDGVNTKMLIESKRSWGVAPSGGTTVSIGTITSVQILRMRLAPPPSQVQQIAIFTLSAPPAVTLTNGQLIAVAGLTNSSTTFLNGQQFLWSSSLSSFVTLGPNQVAVVIGTGNYVQANTTDTGTLSVPQAAFQTGEFIVDINNNIEEAVGAQTATIVNIQVDATTVGGSPARLVTLFFSSSTPLTVAPNVKLHLAGLTTITGLNGAIPAIVAVESSLQLEMVITGTALPITAFSTETGTATTGTGVSGTTQPAWATTPGAVTSDPGGSGGQQWINKGPAVMDWGFAGPQQAPTVTQVAAPTIYPNWAAATWYAPLFVLLDSNGNLEQLVTAGTTGPSVPTWNVTVGGTTNETGPGTAVWKNLGPGTWTATHAYAVNDLVLVTSTYWTTQAVVTPPTNPYSPPIVTYKQVPVTFTNMFQCIVAGTSGANAPSWTNGLNTTVGDGTGALLWKNIGAPAAWAAIGATQTLSLASTVIDNLGNIEQIQGLGKTGATQPTWADQGAITTDGSAQWLNAGPYTTAGTAPWIYAYSGKSSITQQVGTASPLSTPITRSAGNQIVVQGLGVPNPPQDLIVIWRTLQGGSTLFELDEIPNPGPGQSWIYTDTTPDLPTATSPGLNQLIQAPIAGENNPPPSSFMPQCYYLTRIWGFVGNVLQYSAGPDQAGTAGSGDQSFPSSNTFNLPSLGVRAWPTSIGLIVYTDSDIFAVLGQGTNSSPFYVITFQEGVGLAGFDAFAVNGSTAYGMLTSGQVVSMDPGAGETEVGFPIGDLFNSQYVPANTYCAWHQGSSADMALYAADGATGWYRMAAVAAPESGNVWSPQALIQGGVKAVASLNIAPGLRGLLLGPSQQNQPILIRDRSTNQDNGVSYPAYANIAVLQLAQPGTVVGVEFVVTEEPVIAGATPVVVGVFNDEISATYVYLRNRTKDPPNLPQSLTIVSQRHWASQDANTILPCRYFGQQILWATENFPNELLTNTIYGRMPEKARR